jgi:glutamine amidotransferase
MDDDPGWRPLAPGELLHVRSGQHCTSRLVTDRPALPLLAGPA